MTETEKLDFCRIKKIFTEGFGFLTSVHYEENVFFHFSKIKDQETREKLENMNRGEVYAFYTSRAIDGRRKVSKIWTNLKNVDKKLIPEFINKIVDELTNGKTNIFEVAHVIKLLRENKLVSKNDFDRILETPKTINNPSIISAMILEKEHKEVGDVIKSILENKLIFNKGKNKILTKLY